MVIDCSAGDNCANWVVRLLVIYVTMSRNMRLARVGKISKIQTGLLWNMKINYIIRYDCDCRNRIGH